MIVVKSPSRMPEEFPYALTAHASRVIGEREIPLEWVARVLAQPTELSQTRKIPPCGTRWRP